MPVSNEFLIFVLDQLAEWGGVTARKMFGGAGLYRDGRMFGLIAGDVVYLKVDDSNREAFVRAGSSAFKPFADKPVSLSYYEVPPDVLEVPEELIDWAARSLAVQSRKKKK
ncbi:TfoX/Sxy family protein [Desulfosudis oleivorans]|uniref:TfoX domain protein n=1 Tax=Desulfosudis oleivorans (strain DSM 6200 / JCM 39069 / Hxd3) TaxID=96561 RepID=A8ZSR2_DESOH|nr:TfoX/Sxy family protein [Desulfosudis oleivorans]ABW65975.1 TfoX domain protein [Desulfosudis oleivorans Hxd3]